MDITKLIEAAKTEGGEQVFADMVQAQLQADVSAATAKVTAERDALATSVGKLEGKATEFGDEMKPVQALLRDKGHDWRSESGLVALGQALEGGGEPNEDVLAIARQLAGPMAADGMKPLKEENASLKEQLELKGHEVARAVTAADFQHAKTLLRQAQSAKGAPQLLESFEDYFLREHYMPYLHFEDVEAGGKKQRVPVVRNGDVPIMTAEGQAGPVELLSMAYEETNVYTPPPNALPGTPRTRDFFASNGDGTGARPNQNGGPQLPVDAQRLGNTQSLDEYREQRQKVS